MKKESFLYVVFFTFAVAFIFVFIISLVDKMNSKRVARNRELVTAQAFLGAVGKNEKDEASTLSRFSEIFGKEEGDSIVHANIDGEIFLVKKFQGRGLWGTITGVIAVNKDASKIIGLDIISHQETPGLGGRIEEDWFKDQFQGEVISEKGITVRKGEGGSDTDPGNSTVDGITGASLTSAAVEVIVNNQINQLRREVAQ